MVEIRRIREDEFEAFLRAGTLAFSAAAPTPEERDRFRPAFEVDRTAAAFDGASIVGTSAFYTFQLTLPGAGLLPAGGLSWVSVLPTHRRQGVLTEMMRAHFQGLPRPRRSRLDPLRLREPDLPALRLRGRCAARALAHRARVRALRRTRSKRLAASASSSGEKRCCVCPRSTTACVAPTRA